ncbi:hypothetical protein D3C87_1902500 [compost metagenome]
MPEALAASSAAMNSSLVQGSSTVGVRSPSSSRIDLRVTSATAASHRPIEYSLPSHMPLVPGRNSAILVSSMVSGCI